MEASREVTSGVHKLSTKSLLHQRKCKVIPPGERSPHKFEVSIISYVISNTFGGLEAAEELIYFPTACFRGVYQNGTKNHLSRRPQIKYELFPGERSPHKIEVSIISYVISNTFGGLETAEELIYFPTHAGRW